MAATLNGIVINEILADPNGAQNFDTDQDGAFESTDEFIELFNTSGNPVDISGWTLSDGDRSNGKPRLTFPAGTIIPAGEHIVIVTNWSSSEPQPSYVFSLNRNSAIWNDGGDEVILSDGTNTIVATYEGGDDPNDIPAGATVEDFGTPLDGRSIQRVPDPNDPNNFDTLVIGTPTPECFVTGTLIATSSGEAAVETLKIGDLVQTANGQMKAIKWIGRQTVTPETVQNPMRGYPILVKAGALGNSLPARDLYVSPDHALLVEGLLINAGALVNGISILQTEPSDTFTYYHIELAQHALLIAEGTYAESYLPQREDRACYDNADEYTELYPEGPSVLLWPLDYPRVSSYTTVPRYVRKHLQTIATELNGAVALQTA